MSIRPTYRKRSVVQVLADGMAAHPPTGRSCCEEAQLTAAELARRNEELAEAEGEIAALKKTLGEANDARTEWFYRCKDVQDRTKKAEADRDELQAKLDAAEKLSGERQATIKRLLAEHHEFVDATENRPTLDREAVREVVGKHWVVPGDYYMDLLVNDLMALVPAAEGWPDWFGPKVDPDDFEITPLDGHEYEIDGERWTFLSEWEARDLAERYIERASKVEAIARFIEDDQAATGDEDQRVEELARGVYYMAHSYRTCLSWDELGGQEKEPYRDAIRKFWTPTESEGDQ